MDFAVFVPGPEQSGHATGGGRFRDVGKLINAAERPDPLAVFNVVEMDAVGIAGIQGLGGGETTVLAQGHLA